MIRLETSWPPPRRKGALARPKWEAFLRFLLQIPIKAAPMTPAESPS
jgi:hypothetical protein